MRRLASTMLVALAFAGMAGMSRAEGCGNHPDNASPRNTGNPVPSLAVRRATVPLAETRPSRLEVGVVFGMLVRIERVVTHDGPHRLAALQVNHAPLGVYPEL